MMNLINKTKVTLLIIALFSTMSSCEDHLEEELATSISESYLYTTPKGLKTAVVALYHFNRSLYGSGADNLNPLVLIVRADLTITRDGFISGPGNYTQAVEPDDGGSDGVMAYIWNLYYNIATKATAIIASAEEIEGMDEAERIQVIAQAKFFRANSYFILYRIFNNIYATATQNTSQNVFDNINEISSETEIFNLLKSDLDYAIENLNWSTAEFGRVTKGVAKHVRAKVAMWQGDWTEAKSQSESLISNGTHSLVASTNLVFDGDLNNSEQLFVVQFQDGLNGNAGGYEGYDGITVGHRINWNFIAWYYKNIPGMQQTEEYGGRGIGFIRPNDYLLDHFTEPILGGDINDDRDDNNYFRLQTFYNNEATLPDGANLGDPLDIYDRFLDQTAYYRSQHPYCLKYKIEGGDPFQANFFSNVMIYRLAETYLIAAEANMRLNGSGLEYLNAVRARANAAPLSVINQDVILQERARELSFEGQRWYTLKRMGINTMRHQIKTYAGNDDYKNDARERFKDHHINFPVPQRLLDFLGPDYPQNAGY